MLRDVSNTGFSPERFRALVLYLSCASATDAKFGKVKLNKLLYLADFEAYRVLGASITGETYRKQAYGPVASHLPSSLESMEVDGLLSVHVVDVYGYAQEVPVAHSDPQVELFTQEELHVIDAALEELRKHGGKAASEWSHKHSVGWNEVETGQVIPYHSALFDPEPIPVEDIERACALGLERSWAGSRP